jgi:hypothetical protein
MTDATTPQAPPPSRWEDFVDILFSPAEVFRRREKDSPWPPLLVVTLLIAAVMFAMYNALLPAFDAEMSRGMRSAMEKNPQLTPEMANQMQRFSLAALRYGGLLTPIGVVVVAGLMWLLGKVVGSRQTFSAAVLVAAFAFVPDVFMWLASGIQAMLGDPTTFQSQYDFHIGPARFVDPLESSPMLMALLGRLNVFTIWSYALVAIGIAVTGKVSLARGAVASILVWVITSLAAMRGAMQ